MMFDLERAAATIMGLAFKGAVLILAVALIIGLFSSEKGGPTVGEAAPSQGGVIVTGNGRQVRITAQDAESDTSTQLYLKDKENHLLISLQFLKNGMVGYSLGSDPLSSAGYRMPDGTVGFCVGKTGHGVESRSCSILAHADGDLVVELKDRGRKVFRKFRLDSQGEFVSDPPTKGIQP